MFLQVVAAQLQCSGFCSLTHNWTHKNYERLPRPDWSFVSLSMARTCAFGVVTHVDSIDFWGGEWTN